MFGTMFRAIQPNIIATSMGVYVLPLLFNMGYFKLGMKAPSTQAWWMWLGIAIIPIKHKVRMRLDTTFQFTSG